MNLGRSSINFEQKFEKKVKHKKSDILEPVLIKSSQDEKS